MIRRLAVRAVRIGMGLIRNGVQPGTCPICGPTLFFFEGDWLRDDYRCARCYSIPRWRALIHTLSREFPNWRDLRIHESSPGGAASRKLRRECQGYSASHYFPGVPPGTRVGALTCQDLQDLAFPDDAFDLFITQDVFEHLPFPARAFREVMRCVKPGGAHVFTVPWWPDRATIIRAELQNEALIHHVAPDYHGNPIDASGSLVFREWGKDLLRYITESTGGMETKVFEYSDKNYGLAGEHLHVFLTRKPD